MRRRPLPFALLLLGCVLAGAGVSGAAHAAPRVVSAEGTPLHYTQAGDGDVAVVLVHGWSCDASYWAAQVPALAPHYRVVALDLAGHGRSGRPARNWTIGEFADDVVRLVDALALRRVVVVGHSMGGPIAVEAVQRLGTRALGAVGVDTLQQLGPPVPPSPDERAARLAPFRADFAGTTRSFVLGAFFVPESDPEQARRIAEAMAAAPPEVAIPALVGLEDWLLAAPRRRFEFPVVLLNAAYWPLERERLAPVFPQLQVRTFDGVGHFLMMEDPRRFNAALLEELAALRARAQRGR